LVSGLNLLTLLFLFASFFFSLTPYAKGMYSYTPSNSHYFLIFSPDSLSFQFSLTVLSTIALSFLLRGSFPLFSFFTPFSFFIVRSPLLNLLSFDFFFIFYFRCFFSKIFLYDFSDHFFFIWILLVLLLIPILFPFFTPFLAYIL